MRTTLKYKQNKSTTKRISYTLLHISQNIAATITARAPTTPSFPTPLDSPPSTSISTNHTLPEIPDVIATVLSGPIAISCGACRPSNTVSNTASSSVVSSTNSDPKVVPARKSELGKYVASHAS